MPLLQCLGDVPLQQVTQQARVSVSIPEQENAMNQYDVAIVYLMLQQPDHDRAQKLMWSKVGNDRIRAQQIWYAYSTEFNRRLAAERMAMARMASSVFGAVFSAFAGTVSDMEGIRITSSD